MVLTEQKRNYLERLSTKDGVISALAFDQRGALKRLMAKYQDTEPTVTQMEELKVLVADELTKYASSMLLGNPYSGSNNIEEDIDAMILQEISETPPPAPPTAIQSQPRPTIKLRVNGAANGSPSVSSNTSKLTL